MSLPTLKELEDATAGSVVVSEAGMFPQRKGMDGVWHGVADRTSKELLELINRVHRDAFLTVNAVDRTLSAEQWESEREKVARSVAHFEEGLDVDRDVDHMGENGLGLAPVWRAYEPHAEAALTALGFVRTPEPQP